MGQVADYIVTGCAGFMGSHLAQTLLANGNTVTGVDSFTDYYGRPTKERNLEQLTDYSGFRLVEADLTGDHFPDLVKGADGIFHLAAQPGVRGSWGSTFDIYVRDNVLATQRIFETAVRHATRVVWASSSSVYGNAETYPTREEATPRPISPYGVTKLACECLAGAYAESFDLDDVALRYFTVYGPRQRPDMAFSRIVEAILTDTPFTIYGTGEQTRDVTFVGDAVAAMSAAMTRAPRGAVYNVGGGSETSLVDVIATVERIAGRSLDIRRSEAAAGDVRRTAADTTRARDELGWTALTSLEDGLRAQLEASAQWRMR
jgi:nucleoside-diphosphate-sugar epimerase